MKKLKMKYILGSFIIASIFGVLSSCSNDNNTGSSGIPAVVSVSKAVAGDLTPVTLGVPKNVYIIKGSGFSTLQKIYFNDFDTYFNPTLVTDTAIFVTIDEKTPYANVSNELKIVTKGGTVVYHFVIAPPSPTLDNYNPINVAAGDVVTIYGNYFLNPTVKFGDIPATVISSTLTEIKVTVPAGADKKYVSVTNISGTATSTEAVGTAIYDDVFYGIDGAGGWNETHDLANTVSTEVAQGLKAIKVNIDPWSGFQIDMWANGGHPVPAGATGIRFKMKLKADAKVRIIVGGDWGHQVWFNVTTKYDTYVVKWSDLGLTAAPATIGQFTFGSDGTKTIFYIDDLGFKL